MRERDHFIRRWKPWLAALGAALPPSAIAQIDPAHRRLLQVGFEQPLRNDGPIAAYGYYYHNQPGVLDRTNLTLRAAVAPVYVDSELGLRRALGPATDVGLGVAGGGFADTWNEIRQGDFIRGESFTGHGYRLSASVYHQFNPGAVIPVFGFARGAFQQSFFVEDDATADDFELPPNYPATRLRGGLRVGGREPYLRPDVAAEFSLWYDGQYRLDDGEYGFNDDRKLEPATHAFWGRVLLAYTLGSLDHRFEVSMTGGGVLDADRFSAFRLGGSLGLNAEFPLTLPGYFVQEITADRLMVIRAEYAVPVSASGRWLLAPYGSAALVDYLSGFEQSGEWHAGVGLAALFRTRNRRWEAGVTGAYGFNAVRDDDGRGGVALGVMLQHNFNRRGEGAYPAGRREWLGPDSGRSFLRLFQGPR
ncbi:MAG: hypothetical protein ACKVYV_01705 [Limisphaerales bacterium]